MRRQDSHFDRFLKIFAMLTFLTAFPAAPLGAQTARFARAGVSDTLWVQTGLNDVAVNAIAINGNGDLFAGAHGDGIFRSQDNGETWQAVNTGLSNSVIYALAVFNGGDFLFAGSDGDGVFRSADNGESWQQIVSGLTNQAVLSLAIDPAGIIFAGTSLGGIFRSTDLGESWEAANDGLTSGEIVFDLMVHGNGDIYAATNAHGVFRSTDQGDSWTLTGMENVDVRTLLSYTPEKIFAGAWFDGAFRFDPTAAAWSPSGLPATHVMDLTANGSGEIFAATHGRGVSRSNDGGVTWEDFNDGNISGGVWSLALSSEGYLFAGTSGSGIFRTAAPLVTTIDPGIAMLPARFVLEQNYPNPFNPTTVISYQLSVVSEINLSIFDVSGRQVRELVDARQSAGAYEVQWDGRNTRGEAVTSGIYFCTLTDGSQRQTRRMILMR